MPSQQQPRRPAPRYLFGGDRPWDPAAWTASDDRVRGGKSTSELTADASRGTATFSGRLDTTALGGAGFASQRTRDGPGPGGAPAWDLAGCDALVLNVAAAGPPKTYALVLKDAARPPPRADGRERSTVSWEHDFAAPAGGEVVLPLAGFRPTYRGRPAPDAAPLDVGRVTSIGFMMRSYFGEQEGDFSLVVRSLAAVNVEDRRAVETGNGAGRQDTPAEGPSWLSRLWNWRA